MPTGSRRIPRATLEQARVIEAARQPLLSARQAHDPAVPIRWRTFLRGGTTGHKRLVLTLAPVSLALAEGVCIFGLVLGFLGTPATVVMPFFFVTQVLMIIGFPTKERIDAFQS